MIREIRLYGDPVLRRKAEEVKAFDARLKALVQDMFETMEDAGGVGLAAPQIGISQRIFVIDLKGPATRLGVINPHLKISGPLIKGSEGCLSIPGISAQVARPAHVHLQAMDEEGRPFELEAEGLMSRALQHELDHLDGIFFLDRLSLTQRSLLLTKVKRLEKEVAAGHKVERPRENAESVL
ncbi:MAG: peptide deformylase [Chlamydiae bacterium]|nr:peptide deformylase [Chlamydiota bacterium]MBI3265509.1 peptide deformylase [Chlamydiota bacterium]